MEETLTINSDANKRKLSAFKKINNDGIAVICTEYLFTTFIIDYILFKIIFNDFNKFSTGKKFLSSKNVKHLFTFL